MLTPATRCGPTRLARSPHGSNDGRAAQRKTASGCSRRFSWTTRASGGRGKRKAIGRSPRSGSKLAAPGGGPDLDVVALHDAPNDLATFDARQAEIVELRYFAGLTEEEVAKAKALSPATIRREIAAARFWLGRRMQGQR